MEKSQTEMSGDSQSKSDSDQMSALSHISSVDYKGLNFKHGCLPPCNIFTFDSQKPFRHCLSAKWCLIKSLKPALSLPAQLKYESLQTKKSNEVWW